MLVQSFKRTPYAHCQNSFPLTISARFKSCQSRWWLKQSAKQKQTPGLSKWHLDVDEKRSALHAAPARLLLWITGEIWWWYCGCMKRRRLWKRRNAENARLECQETPTLFCSCCDINFWECATSEITTNTLAAYHLRVSVRLSSFVCFWRGKIRRKHERVNRRFEAHESAEIKSFACGARVHFNSAAQQFLNMWLLIGRHTFKSTHAALMKCASVA